MGKAVEQFLEAAEQIENLVMSLILEFREESAPPPSR
jgi:hypothetical protein